MLQTLTRHNKLVQKIHEDFDSAQDRLLAEAQNILEIPSDYKREKAQRLLNLGFEKSSLVVNHKLVTKINSEAKSAAQLIEDYKENYSELKFITEKELDRICKKWKLIYAPVKNYKKDIPEKNLSEIENVKPLNPKDVSNKKLWCKVKYSGGLSIGFLKAKKLGLPERIEGRNFSGWSRIDDYLKTNFPQCSEVKYITNGCTNFEIDTRGLFIAAPKTHFDLKGLKKNGLFGFLNVTITEVKDPIVFRYCKGGVQILSKWGLEESL